MVGTPHTGQGSMVSLAEGVPSCEGHKIVSAPKHILKLTAYLCRRNIYFHNTFQFHR